MSTIKCCKDCVPPERHPCCHDVCERYLKEKEEWEERKASIRKQKQEHARLSSFDFDKISYADYTRNRRGKKKR